MRVLVVEDDAGIRRFLERGLAEEGFAVDTAADGEEAHWKAQDPAYDCVILDLSLPKRDGVAVLRDLRAAGIETPVVVLTARDAVAERVSGLDAGADDYLVKPFALDELLARMRAVGRRHSSSKSTISIGSFVIDRPARLVRWGTSRIDLSSREYAILEFLAQHPGEVISRTRIYDHVWNEQMEPMSNTIDVHIKEIRRKLAAAGAPDPIETVRGAGYRLKEAIP
jgi:DNA-binding response OmpR family regulator